MTNGELVSRVNSVLKGFTKDGRIGRRLILHTAESKAKFLISQKLNDRTLYRESNLYTTINCVEFIDQDVVKCPIIEFRRCKSLKRSKHKLPTPIFSKYGHSVKEVVSLDGEFNFSPITLYQYRQLKNRTLQKKTDYFYVQDGYLYLPDSGVLSADVIIITQDLYAVEQCSECSKNKCNSVWDFDFICPDKILEAVIQETIKELSLTRQIPEDVNPNLNANG